MSELITETPEDNILLVPPPEILEIQETEINNLSPEVEFYYYGQPMYSVPHNKVFVSTFLFNAIKLPPRTGLKITIPQIHSLKCRYPPNIVYFTNNDQTQYRTIDRLVPIQPGVKIQIDNLDELSDYVEGFGMSLATYGMTTMGNNNAFIIYLLVLLLIFIYCRK